MNILHMKYAVEVARLGSLNKAAESLLIAQPNISRSIKELEADLGIAIFSRSAKGMELTPEGEEFIGYAKDILAEIDRVEKRYKNGVRVKRRFSVSVPRAAYVSEAFARFSRQIGDGAAELSYQETGTPATVQSILGGDCKLGIIRYAENYDKYYKSMLEEKGLSYEVVAEFSHVIVMNKEHPLAEKEQIMLSELSPFTEIVQADNQVPPVPVSSAGKTELGGGTDRRILVFERASALDLLAENPEAFTWVCPVPERILSGYGLVQRACTDNLGVYRDVLIYKDGYRLSELDRQFITCLCEAKRKHL